MESSYGIFPSEPEAEHFTARMIGGHEVSLGFFPDADAARVFADKFLCRWHPDNGGLIGTLDFVFTTLGAD